jgi:hypothetical protein
VTSNHSGPARADFGEPLEIEELSQLGRMAVARRYAGDLSFDNANKFIVAKSDLGAEILAALDHFSAVPPSAWRTGEARLTT